MAASTIEDLKAGTNVKYRDELGLDEDFKPFIDISDLINDRGEINASFKKIMSALYHSDVKFCEIDKSNPDFQLFKNFFSEESSWADRFQIIIHLISSYKKQVNSSDQIPVEFDFIPFLKVYINSIMEG